jgi:hypothetical protein
MWTPSSGTIVPNLQVSTRTGQLQKGGKAATKKGTTRSKDAVTDKSGSVATQSGAKGKK